MQGLSSSLGESCPGWVGFSGQRASSGLTSSHASCGCIGLPRAACCCLSLWWVGRRTRKRPQIPLKMKEATWPLCRRAPDPSTLTGSSGTRICRIQAGQHVLFFCSSGPILPSALSFPSSLPRAPDPRLPSITSLHVRVFFPHLASLVWGWSVHNKPPLMGS